MCVVSKRGDFFKPTLKAYFYFSCSTACVDYGMKGTQRFQSPAQSVDTLEHPCVQPKKAGFFSCNGHTDKQVPMGTDTADKNKGSKNPTSTFFSESLPQDKQLGGERVPSKQESPDPCSPFQPFVYAVKYDSLQCLISHIKQKHFPL